MRTEEVPMLKLLEMAAPYNPRKISVHDLSALRRSMRTFGVVEPVVVNRRTSRIVGGHQRVRAAQAEKLASLPVAYVDLDETAERQLNLALNRIHGEWDDERLEALLEELRAGGADLALTGFENEELARLIGSFRGITDADDVPETPVIPKTRPGDLIVLGSHRLLSGDSTKASDVARVLDGAAPRLLLSDPPYGVQLDMEWRDRAGLNGMGPAEGSYMKRAEGHKNVSISGDTKADWSDAFELVPSLDTAYVWHASAHSIEVGLGLRRIGFNLSQQIIWSKPHFALSRQHYHWQHEPCWYARKPGAAKFRGSRDQSTIWEAASPKMLMNPAGEREAKVDHPTQKPAALYTRPIENHLEMDEAFYEPFGGSGTAIIAAEQTGRRCLAIELDPRYCDVIVQRWQDFTGKKAEGWRGNA